MKHNDIRRAELKILAKAMARQFGLTNVLDVQALENELLDKYENGSKLTSQYSPSDNASSAKFRQDVRNALIDIIATFGHLKTIDKTYTGLEQDMRTKIEDYVNQIDAIRLGLVNSDTDNTRAVEGKDLMNLSEAAVGMEFTNGRMRPGTPRVQAKAFNTAEISSTIYPIVDAQNNVLVSEQGILKNVLKTGLNSRTWNVDVYTDVEPKFSIAVSGLESITDTALDITNISGIVCRLALDLTDNPITASELELNFQQQVRILGVLGNGVILKANTLPITTFSAARAHLIPLPENEYTELVMYVHVPKFVDRIKYTDIAADQFDSDQVYVGATMNPDGFLADIERPDYYHYELGMYNLKLRTASVVTSSYIETSEFKSIGALTDASLLHFGKGSPTVTTFWHQDDEILTTRPTAPLARQEVYSSVEFPQPFSAITLLDTPLVATATSVNVYLQKANEADVVIPLVTAPGNKLPQFSTASTPECFLLGRTLIFKSSIDLSLYDTIEINYNVLLTGVHFLIEYTPDAWTHSYTVILNDNTQ